MFGVRGAGRAIFVAILLVITGCLNLIYAIAGLTDANFWGGETNYIFGELHTWSWVTLVIGVVQLLGGALLFFRDAIGRVIGVIAAAIGALGSLLAVGGAYPFWALAAFALCLWCLHGLLVLGQPRHSAAVRAPGER